MSRTVVTYVMNPATDSWEAIETEPWDGTPLDDVEVSAEDIGGYSGQSLRIEILDDFGMVAEGIETVAR